MKVIRKSQMLRSCQEGHLRAERDFLISAEGSRWVVPLVASFQDSANLYLIMEYMIGGDFLGLLFREDVLDEEVASASGHLKISDFGLAFDGHWAHCQSYYSGQRYSLLEKLGIRITGDEQDAKEERDPKTKVELRPARADYDEAAMPDGLLEYRNRTERRKLARSAVGTSQYMAPEWSIGIILYECLYGRTPFYRETRHLTKQCIVDHVNTLNFPKIERWSRPTSEKRRALAPPSATVIDLLCKLLTHKEARLSSAQYRQGEGRCVFPNDAEDIKAHPFFHDVPWTQLHVSKPPFVPRVRRNQSIAKYFDDEKDILRTSGSTMLSILEIDDAVDLEHAKELLGANYSEWRRTRLEAEKRELGMECCCDDELQRIKDHLGPLNYAKWKAERILQVQEDMVDWGMVPPQTVAASAATAKLQQEKKPRPRDKLLRDPIVGRQVMEIRKKVAFYGYTYRRPKMVTSLEGGKKKRSIRPVMSEVF
ncbi:kinase-like protein [Piedraia hortae CBS 480.64]|uniref:non-specific serine/threonine protein kinase n=1 Tax=Piedraia hortae CBS 480.64 TaxID=1314780 RepID=A0A6A7C5X6_9PEZI|nr:kinase-like protein [Piedraia hortae CBS 480.64]